VSSSQSTHHLVGGASEVHGSVPVVDLSPSSYELSGDTSASLAVHSPSSIFASVIVRGPQSRDETVSWALIVEGTIPVVYITGESRAGQSDSDSVSAIQSESSVLTAVVVI
jgi:hypothetical protein